MQSHLINTFLTEKIDRKFVIFSIIAILFSSIVFLLFYNTGNYLILSSYIVVPLVFLLVRYPILWLSTLSLSLFYFFRDSSKDISDLDILYAVVLLGSLFVWFVSEVLINRKKIINGIEDWLLIVFFILSSFNVLIAYSNGVAVIDWAREYSLFILVLYYFPLREYFNDTRKILYLFSLYAIVVLVLDFYQFYSYYAVTLSSVEYAFQLESSVRKNQLIYTAGATVGFGLFLYQRNLFLKILVGVFTLLTSGALILTFSRTFWIILLINIVMFFIFLKPKYKIQISVFLFTFSVLIVGIIMIAFQDKAELFLEIVERRFESSVQGKKDPSVYARLVEYKEVLDDIYKNPIGGNGFAKKISFFNPIDVSTTKTVNIHNGYLFLIFRVGLPLSLFFFSVVLIFFIRSIKLSLDRKNNIDSILSVSMLGIMILIILSNIPSTQWTMRDGPFVQALAFATISVLNSSRKE